MKMHWIRGETLGRGGFAFVSKGITQQEQGVGCSSSNFPPIIAVKSSKSSESKSLVKEKKMFDSLDNCPFVIRCFGDETTKEDGQELYNILLEYASGGCLVDIIKSCCGRGLPEPVVRHHTRSILTALSHMHRLGYVHCDIKPQNILIVKEVDGRSNVKTSSRETAKLADLGSAIDVRGGNDDQDDRGFRGTVLYAAPESITHKTYVPQSDVWSLGCTVLYMLTGKSPWEFDNRTTATDVMMTIGCSDQIPKIPCAKKISKEAIDFLKKCFVKDPASRCTAEALLDHPFVKIRNSHVAGKCSSHHHHLTSRLSHSIINSLVSSCFHVNDSVAVRPI